MKKASILLLLIFITATTTSCAQNEYRDTYFIHAAGFEKVENEYRVYTVCEKLQDKKSDFFVITRSGNSIKEATDSITEDYHDCYFATAKLYFIPDDYDSELITQLAKEICDSNIYPSKSMIFTTKGNPKHFFNKIKGEDELKTIYKLSDNKKTNAVKFFSLYLSGKKPELTTLNLQQQGKIGIYNKKSKDNSDEK